MLDGPKSGISAPRIKPGTPSHSAECKRIMAKEREKKKIERIEEENE